MLLKAIKTQGINELRMIQTGYGSAYSFIIKPTQYDELYHTRFTILISIPYSHLYNDDGCQAEAFLV